VTETPDDYLSKSPAAGRMGKAAEYLVASVCILATRGKLNVSTSIVDDEGVDIVFHLRDATATLAVQVKARMTDGSVVRRGRFQAQVRSTTFRARQDLDVLFVLVDNVNGLIQTAWLVPSREFERLHGTPTKKGGLRFSASIRDGTSDQWSPFRVSAAELPVKIIERLEVLDAG